MNSPSKRLGIKIYDSRPRHEEYQTTTRPIGNYTDFDQVRSRLGLNLTQKDEDELQEEYDKITSLEQSASNNLDYITRCLGAEALNE